MLFEDSRSPRLIAFAGLAVAALLTSIWLPPTNSAQNKRSTSTKQANPTTSAASLLRQGTSYQAVDDVSDRAADYYRLVLQKYPTSSQAEQAQFYLASYYQKKFFILEQRSKTQDWSAFNEAENALNAYVTNYSKKGTGSYLGDAYHTLGVISLRRGYVDSARKYFDSMAKVGARDRSVFIYKVVWSANPADVVNKTCKTETLAAGSLQSIKSPFNFDTFLNDLRAWCRKNCP
jgi:hypothetical protein